MEKYDDSIHVVVNLSPCQLLTHILSQFPSVYFNPQAGSGWNLNEPVLTIQDWLLEDVLSQWVLRVHVLIDVEIGQRGSKLHRRRNTDRARGAGVGGHGHAVGAGQGRDLPTFGEPSATGDVGLDYRDLATDNEIPETPAGEFGLAGHHWN